MTIDLSTFFAIAVPTVGAIFWLAHLEGRISVNDVRHADIIGRLERIERKLDAANGQHD